MDLGIVAYLGLNSLLISRQRRDHIQRSTGCASRFTAMRHIKIHATSPTLTLKGVAKGLVNGVAFNA